MLQSAWYKGMAKGHGKGNVARAWFRSMWQVYGERAWDKGMVQGHGTRECGKGIWQGHGAIWDKGMRQEHGTRSRWIGHMASV